MWTWKPAASIPVPAASRSASTACSGVSPNFEPWWAVRIAACVSASIPGVTRTRIRLTPASAARSTSSGASTTTSPASCAARCSSSSDLLFPCMTIRAGGISAFTAYASSPSVETSAPSPSSAQRRRSSRLGKAFTL